MSYGISGRVEADQDASQVLDEIKVNTHGDLEPDAAYQRDAAINAAASLIESGQLGQGPWHVNISGHANPGHADRAGWANDHVSISISRLSPTQDPTNAQEG